jgi:protein phosphatase
VIAIGLLALGMLLLCWLALNLRTTAKQTAAAPPAKPPEEPALSARPPRAASSAPPRPEPLEAPPPEEDSERPSRIVLAYEDEAEEETTSPLARILVSARGDSDRGRTRPANDDSLLIMSECSLFAVADGMGGYAGGQVASSLAVETLRQAFERGSFVGELRADKPIPRRAQELASSILQSNWAVCDARRATPALAQMGTTLVAARFSPNKQRVYIGHVGDSRCYRLRAGTLRQLTTDQTLGLIGLQGPRAHDLLQALGVTRDLAIDLIVDKPLPNDVYLLCSDGLSKMASDQEIQEILLGEPDLEAAVYGLIERANDRGGTDNVTVVLIKVIERALKVASPISTQALKAKGWSKLPNIAVHNTADHEDETVVGSLPFDEPTVVGVIPVKGHRG